QRSIEIFKILIAEKALGAGPVWAGNVLEAHQKKDANAPVKLRPQLAEEFLSVGCIGADAKLKVKDEKATVTTAKKGTLTCKEVEATFKHDKGQVDYRGWLNGTLPFGWARFSSETRLGDQELAIFTATYRDKGADAKSELVSIK